MRAFTVVALGLLASGMLAQARADSGHAQAEYLAAEQTRKANLPFSDAVKVGNVLYLSGRVGTAPGSTKLVPGGIEAETQQALENIRAVLEQNGSSMDHVVKCTVMLADMSEWAKMNAVYVTFFPKHFPARSAMGVSGLVLGARVEIECLATER